jgi:hypothetical protein
MQFINNLLGTSAPRPKNWKIGFERVKQIIAAGDYVLINTLPEDKQGVLIRGTLAAADEVRRINDLLEGGDQENYCIVIYGENHTDDTIMKKRAQLMDLGFTRVYCYLGGLFEWLLLQDVFGEEEFPMTADASGVDLLAYRPV